MKDDLVLDRHPSVEEGRCLFTTFERATPEEGTDEAVLTFVGSTIGEDRYGSVIDPMGAELDNFLKNPVFMWAHDYSQPPIGVVTKVVQTKKLLKFTVKFAVEENPFAKTVYNLYKGGYLSGVSIGMIPKAWEEIEAKSIPSGWAENRKYTKWELLELSAAPIPANRDALKMAVRSGSFTRGDFTHGLENYYEPEERAGAVLNRKNKERLAAIKDLVDEILATAEAKDEEDATRQVEPVTPVAADEEVPFSEEELQEIVETIRTLTGSNLGLTEPTKVREGVTSRNYVDLILGR